MSVELCSTKDPAETRATACTPKVTVVMLNWNGIDETRKALASLHRSQYPNLSIVLVDNNSKNHEGARLQAEFPKVEVLCQPFNYGFARAVNIGAHRAMQNGAKYVILFNNDAWIEPDIPVIERLVSEAERDPRLGLIAPLIVNDDPEKSVQAAGHHFSLFWMLPRGAMMGVPFSEREFAGTFDFLTGACLLIRSEAFNEINGMDPDFFLYADDIDLAYRIRRLGYGQRLLKDVYVVHRKSVATTMFSEKHIYTLTRSLLILMRKHARWYHWLTAPLSLLCISCGLALMNRIRIRERGFNAVYRAWRDFLAGRWGGYDGLWECPPPDLDFSCFREVALR